MGSSKETFLRNLGIQASEVSGSRMIRVPHTALLLAPEGHWAHDPRSLYEPDPEMVRDMIGRFERKEPNANEKPLLCWPEPVDAKGDEGGDRLLVGDGSQRTNAATAAFAELRRRKLLGAGDCLMLAVEWHKGDRASFLEARLQRNDHSRLARPDTASVLAYRVAQLIPLGRTHAQIAAKIGRGVTSGVVEALERWDEVAAGVQRKIDAGDIPLALLPELVTLSKGAQEARAAELVAAGVRTSKGATRRRNKAQEVRDPWARPMGRRALWKVGKALGEPVWGGNRYAEGVADALKLASLSGEDAKKHLDNMPRKVADAIRLARGGA